MVASHGALLFLNTSVLVRSLNAHAPGSAIRCDTVPGNCGLTPAVAATASMVPMTGTAPGAKIYAMKVFPATGGGAPESRIIGAMDCAITLRRTFNSTGVNTRNGFRRRDQTSPFVYSSLKIDVVNMSLGGPTLFAGRGYRRPADAGDALRPRHHRLSPRPATTATRPLTGGSPGTGFRLADHRRPPTLAVHQRVLRENQFGFGAGEVFRPTTHSADRLFQLDVVRPRTACIHPDITANGFASFTRAFTALTVTGGLVDRREPEAVPGPAPRGRCSFGHVVLVTNRSRRSALLRGAHPTKNSTQIRNALQQSANLTALGDGSTRIDQGTWACSTSPPLMRS